MTAADFDKFDILSVGISPATQAQIEDLIAAGFGDKSHILSTAIERMWMAECRRPESNEHVQLWQHRVTGGRYAVLLGDNVQGAFGPLSSGDAEQFMTLGLDWECPWSPELARIFDANQEMFRVIWPYASP